MTLGRLEVLVEPFKENDPGPHVLAVLKVLEDAGFSVDMGPFSTTVDDDLDALIEIIHPLCRAGFTTGATSIQTRLIKT